MTAALYPVAILAGGLATRLRPLTEKIPKALIDIAGEPFIAHQLRLLKKQGASRVVICAGFLGEMIRDVVRDGRDYGLDVEYSFDGDPLLGTAGALKKALPFLAENFLTLYGDSYLTCDFANVQKAFAASGKQALMTVYRNEGQFDTSNVEFEGGRIIAYDKKNRTPRMRYIDYGLGVFNAAPFESIPDGVPWDLATVYADALRNDQLAACEISERFYEIGSVAGIEELRELLERKE